MASCVLVTVALLMVPQADIPETQFDEANIPTNEMVVEEVASSKESRQSIVLLEPWMFVPTRRIDLRTIFPIQLDRLSGSRPLTDLLCTLLC